MPATHDTQYQAIMIKRKLLKYKTQLKNLPITKCKFEKRVTDLETEKQRFIEKLNDLRGVRIRLESDIASLGNTLQNIQQKK